MIDITKNGFSNLVPAILIAIIITTNATVYSSQTIEQTPIPSTEINSNGLVVSLGQEFTLKKGETARVKDLEVLLKLKSFIYSPCPEGTACFVEGSSVIFDFTVDGKTYGSSWGNPPPKVIYQAQVMVSDYKTYATFVIKAFDNTEIDCARQPGILQEESCRGLAKEFDDPVYCNKIDNPAAKDKCFEDLASQRSNGNLCENVASPKHYCQYLKVVLQNTLAQCDSINTFHWRVRCFKEISEKSGQGIDACNALESGKAIVCREAISGSEF